MNPRPGGIQWFISLFPQDRFHLPLQTKYIKKWIQNSQREGRGGLAAVKLHWLVNLAVSASLAATERSRCVLPVCAGRFRWAAVYTRRKMRDQQAASSEKLKPAYRFKASC